MRRAAALLAALVVAGAAAAGPFDGLWRANPTDSCTQTGTGATLRIEDDVMQGADSSCRMTDPVTVRDMDAILYDMECEGADESWSDRAFLMNAADGGLILVWNGFAFAYARCADDAMVGTVTTADEIGIVNGQDRAEEDGDE